MTDALNVRISSDDDGDALVIKNAYGNDEITLETALPAGTNKVIGSVANDKSGSIYYFIWNSNDDHSIYKYSVGSDKSKLVYSDSVLGFSRNGFVKANIVTSIDGDELLYFNTGTSAPKKINASKALRSTSYPGGSTDEEKLLFLTVAKQPPLSAPSYNIVNNPDIKENKISDKVFQFAYRYVYEDGEVSALSPYSSLTTSVAQLRDGFNTQSALDFYNEIEVYVRNTIADVDKIQLFARQGNEGTFYQIAEKNNNKNTNAVTIKFSNNIKGVALPQTDKNKLYDNVPQLADSQEVVNGRLMYGGYTEGYPNFLEEGDVALIDNYKDTEDIYNITLTASSSGTGVTKMTIDSSDLPSTFTEDSTIYFNFVYSGDTVTIGGTTSSAYLDFITNYDITISDIDGSNSESVTVNRTKDSVSFIPSGIHISEKISISSGQTDADAVAAIRSRLTSKKYNLMLAPTANQNVVFGSSGTAFTDLTALLNGRAIIQPKEISGSTSEIELDIVGLELYLGGVNTQINPLKIAKGLFNIGNQRSEIVNDFVESGSVNNFVSKMFKGGSQKNIINSSIIVMDINDGHNLAYEFSTPYVLGNSFASATKDSATKSFKSGSSHELGIVYYDDRNRSGGVQELGDVYIKSLNDRTLEGDLYGAASVVMRLPDAAPSWAKRWAPVYKGRGKSELKLMYTIDGAFAPFKTNSDLQSPPNNNKIYLSLNSVFGEKMGYNISTGANIEYKFRSGDRLRIIEYNEGQRIDKQFAVLGYEVLDQSSDNPILDTSASRTIQRTTGNFLIIEEDEGATGFTIKDIINRNTNWNKRCVIEIYNSNIEDTDIYYEIGKSYEVVNGVHSDERTATTFTATASAGLLTSATQVFKGDILETAGQPSLTILNSWERSGTYYAKYRTAPTFVDGSYSFTVSNPEKVVDISLGDVYFRRRSLYTSVTNEKLVSGLAANTPTTAIVKYIEDYSVSDFFDSKSTSIGRPIAYIPNAKTVKRSGSITYSEPYLQEGTFNGLSSFNLSLANFKDLAYEYGSIKSLVGYNERLYFIQEDRSGVLAVNRNVIETGSGDNLVTLSKNILQSEQYYVGEYGTTNPESVASRDGMVYFTDVKRNKVLRIDGQGLTIISDVNLASYFDEKFGVISKYGTTNVVAGIDKDNDEYILSSDTITEAVVAINTDQYVYTAQIDESQTKVLAPVSVNNSAVFGFNTDPRNFNEVCDEFQDSLKSIAYLDDIEDGGSIFIDSSVLEPIQIVPVYGVATNSNFDFFVAITVDPLASSFVFDNDYCDSDDTGSINPSSSVLDAFTIAYGTDDKVWTTRYSFVPESIVSLHNEMYTFKSGKIYKHSEDVDRNTYYGAATAESIVEVVSNEAPSAIKTFESLSLEGDAAWDAVVSTTNQTSTIDDTSFKDKEGFYYAYIHGSTSSYGSQITSVNSTSEIFSLGVVAADVTSGSAVTFSNAVNTISFPLGSTATLYKVNTASNRLDTLGVYPLSVTGQKSITFSGNITVSAGDLLVVVGNSAIEGDQIRDYFAKIKLTKTTSAPIELFAVNTVITDSKLHN